MKRLLHLIKWDIRLLIKYGIVYVAIGIALLYVASILYFDVEHVDKLLVTLVFSDPVMYGFLFSAIIVLFERDANLHQVFSITPLPRTYYLWSKSIVFTLLALVCSIVIIIAYQPQQINWLLFVLAILLSTSLYVFIGIVGALYVRNFNQFILTIPIVLAPACIPFIEFYGLFNSSLFYLFPTQASLILFEGALVDKSMWQIIYAIVYLLGWNVLAFWMALRVYKTKI